MATTIRQIRRCVQKIAQKARLTPEETKLVIDCVTGISKSESWKVSDIVRALKNRIPFREETRNVYDQLADPKAEFEQVRDAWLDTVAPTANNMPFIAVDPSDIIIKPYGKEFDYLGTVRDASDPDKFACGIQSIWLLTRPAMAKRLIARVKVFIDDVPFKSYRLWDGVKDALCSGA